MGWIYVVIPVSAGLMAIWMVLHTIEAAVQLCGRG
jgi:TRAP-type C4-dicarboxylate transport system permease small subunit